MGLQKSVISIPMSLGIDTENAAPLIENDRFATLSNVVFNKDSRGQLHKRSGHAPLPVAIQGGGVLPAAQLLEIFNEESGVIAGGSLYGYSSTSQNWIPRGTPPFVQQAETNIAAGAFSVQNPDAVILNGLAYYSYEMNGSSWVKVVDDTTKSVKATISLKGVIGAATATPKMVSNGSSVICLTVDSSGTGTNGSLWGVVISATNFSTSKVQLATGLDTWFPTGGSSSREFIMDASLLSGTLYVAYIAGSTLKGSSFNASTLASISTVSIVGLVAPAALSVAAVGANVAVTYQASSGTFTTQEYTSSAWATGTSFSFGVGSTQSPRLATTQVSGTGYGGGTYLAVFYEQAPANSSSLSTVYIYLGGVGIPSLWAIGVNIAGLPFTNGGNIYLPVVYPSTDQQTFFLLYQGASTTPSGLASVAGRYYSDNDAGAAPANYRMAQNFGTVSIPVIVQPQGTSAATVSASLAELSLTFNIQAQFSQLGFNQHMAIGSQLYDYDGTNIFEHNFHLFPEAPMLTNLASVLAVITDSYDPTNDGSAGRGTYRIAIPDNPTNPGGPIGQLITPGEYITLYTAAVPTEPYTVIYFTVNGVGAAPVGTGASIVTPCALSSGMTSIQVAQTLKTTLLTVTAGLYTVTYTSTPQANTWTPQYIGLADVANVGINVYMPPVLSRMSQAFQVYVGNGAVTKEAVGISFPPGKLISSNQYVTFACLNGSGGLMQTYIWFANASNPTVGNETVVPADPMPFGPLTTSGTVNGYSVTYSTGSSGYSYLGIKIILAGTENEIQVAAAVNAALAAGPGTIPNMFYGGGFGAAAQANVVSIQAAMTVGIPLIQQAYYPTTNVGQNYVGDIVDGVTNLVAINYQIVSEWIDSQNQLHQSAPSVPATAYIPTYTATGGGFIPAGASVPFSAVIQLGVTPLSLTRKTSALTGTDVDFAIYRTISGAQPGALVYYRVTPTSQLFFNATTATSLLTYADYSSDTAIQSNQVIYTTGDVLENSAPPACSYVINHQNRLWLAGLENPNELWYSETWESGFSVNFSNLQQVLLNPIVGQVTGGPIVALASMDSNLIIFQENQVWYIQGSGPDATGGNGFFAPPQIVASSSQIGCRDPNSVVLMPNGVIFKSTQGYWLLGRDLQLRYIGAPVKTFNADIVTSAVALASNSQINFLSGSGTTLMYDWYYDSWASFTTNGVDSLLDASGNFNLITNSGAIWVQQEGMYYDGDGTPVTMTIQTAWLKPGNVQGFQRIWKAFLEGQFYGAQPYLVQIAYNYVSTPVDNFVFNNGAGGTTIGDWGGSPTWGAFIWGEDGSTVVSYPDTIQIRVFPSNQLCESMQITISDFPPVPTSQTWALNALDLELGVRTGGMKRLGPSQSLG